MAASQVMRNKGQNDAAKVIKALHEDPEELGPKLKKAMTVTFKEQLEEVKSTTKAKVVQTKKSLKKSLSRKGQDLERGGGLGSGPRGQGRP